MSKLSIHFQQIPANILAIVNATPIKWLKVVDPPVNDPFRPEIKVIGRVYHPEDMDNDLIRRGAEGAEHYFNMNRGYYQFRQYVQCWEGPNEPPVKMPWQREMLMVFTRRWVELMHAHGYKVAVWSLSVGWPNEHGDVLELAPCLENADFLSLHEYSAPEMSSDQGWLCLRYRRTVDILRQNGYRVPPILITECGIDGGVINRPKTGWKTFGNREHYQQSLQWYDSEIARDDYVECATIFTSGPYSDWVDFDFDEPLSRWLASQYAQPPTDLERIIGDAMQEFIIDWNPSYAFPKAAIPLGRLPQSEEQRIDIDGTRYAYQAFRHPKEPEVQHGVYCIENDWGNLKWFTREN